MRTVDYTDGALIDLTRIWLRVAESAGVRRADEIKSKIEERLTGIVAKHPGSGRLRPEFGPDVRSFLISWPYVAFYRHVGRRIEILRILHGHRDIHEPLMSLLTAVS